jgi:hypothetical protein
MWSTPPTLKPGSSAEEILHERRALNYFAVLSALSIFSASFSLSIRIFGSGLFGTATYSITIFALLMSSIAALFLWRGFQIFARLDNPSFRTPTTLCFVSVFANPIILISYVHYLTSGQALGIIVLGIIFALVGDLGALTGLWRLGKRYGDSRLKASAVIFLIPYVSIIGYVLVLISARGIKKSRKTRESDSNQVKLDGFVKH